MTFTPQVLLLGAVVAVGILHTMVPDHWMPITLIARQKKWSKRQTARAALQAETGHVITTLLIALVVWIAGVAVATYLILCVYSTAGLGHMKFPVFERHGEVLSGTFITIIGLVFLIWPVI